MNENIKVFFGFVAGAAIGAVVSYFVTEKKLSKDFELALDEYKNSSEITKEIDDAISETDNAKTTIENEEVKENDDMNKKDIPQEAINAYKNMQEGVRKAKARREMHNYGNVERDISRPTIDEIEGRDEEHNESVKFIRNKPVIVSYDEYDDNKLRYRQVDLYFDARDFKLFDDDGAEVEDMGIMVGYDNMEKLADSDESDMYIRNDNLKEYYCVTTEYRID